MSLLIAWSYFHKMYEGQSDLARNFLLIAPNIIVLDRLRSDFEGLKIFLQDPVIPTNGYKGKDWQNDFQLDLSIQDEVSHTQGQRNLFLTNIHRVYTDKEQEIEDDDFLGSRPVTKTLDSVTDLKEIVKNVDELMVINDEAHHIHDDKLAWFGAIEDIHQQFQQKGKSLSLQIDLTATPKDQDGVIFVQTVSDYPLVEAIAQNMVKHPVLPDEGSRKKLQEKQTSNYVESFEDYLKLGVQEWKKAFKENNKLGQKSILFVMTDDTKNCDKVSEYLEASCPELKGAVLSIHTNRSGEISQAQSSKSKKELEKLRKQANEIDNSDNPYKAIVSVLVLKEGWDVKNVTTIVGLRPYSSKGRILPEQTLGRGLRLMYRDTCEMEEKVSVIGTSAFMEFVEDIQKEGVVLEFEGMGGRTSSKTPTLIEVDVDKSQKTISDMDIYIPILSCKFFRDYKDLSKIKPDQFEWSQISKNKYAIDNVKEVQGQRLISFKYMVVDRQENPYSHEMVLDDVSNDWTGDPSGYIHFFTKVLMRELRLTNSYDIIYEKMKEFIRDHLFKKSVDLDERIGIRLSDREITKTIIDTFKKEINALTVQEDQNVQFTGKFLQISQTRPFRVKQRDSIKAKKSVFNRIVGDNRLERDFALFLEGCEDIVSYAKLYDAIGFKLDYLDKDDHIRHYFPDFVVKASARKLFVVETKGREDLNDPLKLERLKAWCDDVNRQGLPAKWDFVLVREEDFRRYTFCSFKELLQLCKRTDG